MGNPMEFNGIDVAIDADPGPATNGVVTDRASVLGGVVGVGTVGAKLLPPLTAGSVFTGVILAD
jgi:hypothetical protein